MLKPLPFEGVVNTPMVSKPGRLNINFPSIFTSNWQYDNGKKAQFFVNYLPNEQIIVLNTENLKDVELFNSSSDKKGNKLNSGIQNIKIAPFSDSRNNTCP